MLNTIPTQLLTTGRSTHPKLVNVLPGAPLTFRFATAKVTVDGDMQARLLVFLDGRCVRVITHNATEATDLVLSEPGTYSMEIEVLQGMCNAGVAVVPQEPMIELTDADMEPGATDAKIDAIDAKADRDAMKPTPRQLKEAAVEPTAHQFKPEEKPKEETKRRGMFRSGKSTG